MTDDFQVDHRLDDLIEGLWRVLGDRGLSWETKVLETIRVGERMGVLEEQSPTEKAPEKCSWCDRGTWTDSNNQRRRCAYCAGTGAAPKPTTSRTA